MSEQLKPCPDGHPASTPYHIEQDRMWWLGCKDPTCGWHVCGTSKAEVTRHWQARTPSPATKAVTRLIQGLIAIDFVPERAKEITQAFLAEWTNPSPSTCTVDLTPGTATIEETDEPETSPWKCTICNATVRIASDLQPQHIGTGYDHEAELSDEDRKILADGAGLTK